MSDKGFIVIDRKILEWKWWGNTNAMSIWLYILMYANWKDGYWAVTGEQVKRGSFITSMSKMASDLSLNRRTIKHWLNAFKTDGQIDYECTARYTRITVMKYGLYQDLENDSAQLTAQQSAHLTAQQSAHNRTIETKKQSNKVSKRNKRKKTDPGIELTDQTDPMTIKSVRKYAEEIGHPEFNAEKFCSKYKNLEDWKGKVRQWIATERKHPEPVQRAEVLPAYYMTTQNEFATDNDDDHPKVDRDALMREIREKSREN